MAVPEPYLDRSGRNVLTMEFFDGVPIDDLAQVADLGFDPTPLVQEVMRAFFLTTVRWGAFHGDVHAGNMMLLRDGRIGVIDWGIVGRLDPSTHRFFISLLSAAMGDEAAWPVVTRHITDVYGPAIGIAVGLSDEELPAFFRSIVEPALTRPSGRSAWPASCRRSSCRWPRRRASRRTGAACGRSCADCGPNAGSDEWPTSRAA